MNRNQLRFEGLNKGASWGEECEQAKWEGPLPSTLTGTSHFSRHTTVQTSKPELVTIHHGDKAECNFWWQLYLWGSSGNVGCSPCCLAWHSVRAKRRASAGCLWWQLCMLSLFWSVMAPTVPFSRSKSRSDSHPTQWFRADQCYKYRTPSMV